MENQETRDKSTDSLQKFKDETENVIAVAIICKDGSVATSFFPSSFDKETISVIVSSVVQTTKEGIKQFGGQNFKRLLLKSQQGFIVIHELTDKHFLFILTNEQTKPASLLLATQELADKISEDKDKNTEHMKDAKGTENTDE